MSATRGVGTVLQFIIAAVLGWWAGPATLGAYYLYLAWASILAKVFGLGHSTALMRYGGQARAEPRRTSLAWVFRRTAVLVLASGTVGTTVIGLFGTPILERWGIAPPPIGIILAAGLGGIGIAVTKLGADLLKGLARAHLGLFFEFDLPQMFFLALVLGSFALGVELKSETVILYHVAAVSVAGVGCIWRAAHHARPVSASRGSGRPESIKLIHASYWGVSAINHLFAVAPYVVLPFFATNAEIGIFGVVHRLVAVAGTLNVALGALFAPRFVAGRGERFGPAAIAAFRQSQVYAVLFYAPFCAVYVFLPEQMLNVFGGGFSTLAPLLVILAILRLGNATAGSAEYFLNMTGRGRLEFASGALGLAVFFVLVTLLHGRADIYEVGVAFGLAFLLRGSLSVGTIYVLSFLRRWPNEVREGYPGETFRDADAAGLASEGARTSQQG